MQEGSPLPPNLPNALLSNHERRLKCFSGIDRLREDRNLDSILVISALADTFTTHRKKGATYV